MSAVFPRKTNKQQLNPIHPSVWYLIAVNCSHIMEQFFLCCHLSSLSTTTTREIP